MHKFFSNLRNNHETSFRLLLFALSIFLILYSFPKKNKFKYEFSKGKIWMHETIFSPFDFPIVKNEIEIEKEISLIYQQHIPLFEYNDDIFKIKAEDFVNQFELEWSKNNKLKKDKRFTLSNLFKSNKAKPNNKKYDLAEFGYHLLYDIYSKGIIYSDEKFKDKNQSEILLKRDLTAEKVNINSLYTLETASNKINSITGLNDNEYEFLVPLLLSCLEYNVNYNKFLDERLLNNEIENISPTQGYVLKGEKIIENGDVVNSVNYDKIASLKAQYELSEQNNLSYFSILFAQTILIFIALFIFYLFLSHYRKEISNNTTKITMILSLIIIITITSSLVIHVKPSFLYVIPFCLLPIILKAFFDDQIALFSFIVTILIIGFIAPNGYEFVFLQFFAGTISILTVLKMYKRSQLFISILKIITVYILIYIAFSVIHTGSFLTIEWNILINFVFSGILTLLAYPLIFLFEKAFRLVSDISLLELTDTNSILLRKLSEEAPGTFQHSIQVANLAEEGVLEIGGNALLVRAGAIYHDIGKIKNPLYFIENQRPEFNPHDNISFEESAEIIINHVIDGISIAKEYKLPDELIDFIRTHHGTTTVQYFYEQYLKDKNIEGIDKNLFKYPGPKPYSKETAVLMMADACEAASRSLKEVTSKSIDLLVENIISKQIEQDQFINANITFKEISQIKKIFKKRLLDINHVRPEY